MVRIYILLSAIFISSSVCGASAANAGDDPFAPYQARVDVCPDIQSVYDLGLKFLRGQEAGFGKDTRETLLGAQLCFVRILERLVDGKAVDIVDDKGSLHHRTLHNLGITFKKSGDNKRAFQNLSQAAKLGFAPSKAALHEMETAGQTPKSDRGDLAGAEELRRRINLMAENMEKMTDRTTGAIDSIQRLVCRALIPGVSAEEIRALVSEEPLNALQRDMRSQLATGTAAILAGARSAADTLEVSQKAGIDQLCKYAGSLRIASSSIEVIPQHDLFTRGALDGIFRLANQIGSKVMKDDAVIFVGRSPLWFLEAMNALNLPGKRYSMPFSVGGIDLVSEGAFERYGESIMRHYPEFLRSKGFDANYWRTNPHGNIVLVDRVESAQSTLLFATILGKALESEDSRRIKILGLVKPGLRVSSMRDISISTLDIPEEALKHTYDKHDTSQSRSLGTPFHPVHWHRWKDGEFMAEVRGAPASARLKQIRDYADELLMDGCFDELLIDLWADELVKDFPKTSDGAAAGAGSA